MDPLSHLILTRMIIGPGNGPLVMAIAPDMPFYSCYPAWVGRQGLLGEALRSGAWPEPPEWLLTMHRATHSALMPGLLLVFGTFAGRRLIRLAAWSWLLHILVDLPTHAREPWGPRPLWPLRDVAVNGVGWADLLALQIARVAKFFAGRH